jgi:hypothetical protein
VNPDANNKAKPSGRCDQATPLVWHSQPGNKDLPAEFDENENKIYMNPDHPRVTKEVDFWAAEYGKSEAKKIQIEAVVRWHFGWIMQLLVTQWRTRQVGLSAADQGSLVRGSGIVAAFYGSYSGIRQAIKSDLKARFPKDQNLVS